MGYGTIFTTEVYINKVIFSHEWELDDKIKEIESDIEFIKRELTSFASATPNDITPKTDDGDTQNPMEYILSRTTELFEWLEDSYSQLNRLYQLKEYIRENPNLDFNEIKDI